MHHIIFHGSNSDPNLGAILQRARKPGCTAIVFGATVASETDINTTIRLSLDPTNQAGSFNPLDVLNYLPEVELEYALSMLLEPLRPVSPVDIQLNNVSGLSSEPVWTSLAVELLQSLVQYQLSCKERPPSLVRALNILFSDDVVYNLAVLLDKKGKLIGPDIYATLATFLQRSDEHRSAILTVVHAAITSLNTNFGQHALDQTSFDLASVVNGGATVYVDIGPDVSGWRRTIPQLWLAAFLLVAGRSYKQGKPVLVVLDNRAVTAMFPQAAAAQRLRAGAVELWTCWESLAQLRHTCPKEWSAFIANCQSVEAWGTQNPAAANELASAFGVPVTELKRLVAGDWWNLSNNKKEMQIEAAKGTMPPRKWGHRTIFAPVRADKWAEIKRALLLAPQRPAIIVESAGECYASTAVQRAKIGHVVRLDPFGILGERGDQFNAFDLLSVEPPAKKYDVYEFADMFVNSSTPSVDPFWYSCTVSLIRATLQYLLSIPEMPKTLGELHKVLIGNDVVYGLAVILDTKGKVLPEDSRSEISAFLQRSDTVRSRILAEIAKSLLPASVSSIQQVTERTTFGLDLLADSPNTVYLEMPAQLWGSRGAIGRMWLAALLHMVRTSADSENPILLIADNAASVEMFPQLLTAQRMREGALEVWSFWDSLGQLRLSQPAEWSAFLGTSRKVEAWGPASTIVTSELAEAFGVRTGFTSLGAGARWDLSSEESTHAMKGAPGAETKWEQGHMTTFASGRSNYWASVAAGILESTGTPLIVAETSGQCYELTSAQRKKTGPIVRLDPFGILGEASDQFNPLDLLGLSPLADADSFRIAELLVPQDPAGVAPFWRTQTISLLLGLMGSLEFASTNEKRNLIQLRKSLSENIKSRVESGGDQLPEESRQLLNAFLARSEVHRDSLIAIADQALRIVGDPRVAFAVDRSSFDFCSPEIRRPLTIYIELPLDRWPSSMLLARLWVYSLLQLSTTGKDGLKPHFIFDIAFSSALFSELEPMQRSSSSTLWTFWESPNQLRAHHSAEFSGFLNNAQRIEAIGPVSPVVAAELATFFGCSRESIQRLAPGHRLALQD